jgi:hypothetical protein
MSGGLELGECNLYDLQTPVQVDSAIRAYVAAHPDLEWVRGNGWQLPVFAQANPTRQRLDAVVPDRPALFYAADGHSAWVNSRALALAGVTRATPDPVDGRIERDAAGEPSGTLREGAMNLVSKHLPEYTRAQLIDGLKHAQNYANSFGITSINDANAGESYLKAYADLDRQDSLTVRVTASLESEGHPVAEEVTRLLKLAAAYRGRMLQTGTVKIFADGVIESHTAALLLPYLGHGSDRGPLNYEPDSLNALVLALDSAGFQVHVHAIGDRAIRATLDAFEKAREAHGDRDNRHFIAHLELIDSADIPRFRTLNVTASFQSFWAIRDEYIKDLTEPVLGPARSSHLYPIGSVMRSGAIVVGGSDWTVSSLNPLDAIQTALTRRAVDSGAGPAWLPDERVDLVDMLAAYTINAAWLNHQEREVGSLEAGKAADLVILDRNLFAIPPSEIHAVKPILTIVDGRIVYARR